MSDETAGPEKKNPKGVRMRIKMEDSVAKGAYSNTAFVHHNENEFVLDFLYAEPARGEGHVVSRVITNPKAAKQLQIGLKALLDRYEERFGEVKLPKKNPPVEPGSYH